MANEDAYSEPFDAPPQENSLTNLNMNIQITSVPIIRSPELNKFNLVGNEIKAKDSED